MVVHRARAAYGRERGCSMTARKHHRRAFLKPLGFVGVVASLFAIVSLLWMGGNVSDGPLDEALAAGADFALDSVAAEDTTYFHSGPSEGSEIGTSEGQDLGYDDRTINVDVVEQLEAADFNCSDRIILFTRVTVDPGGTDNDQTIFLTYHFDAVNNGQPGVGYSDVLSVGISDLGFPPASQSADTGNIGIAGAGDTETVSLEREQFLPSGSTFGVDALDLEAVVKVTDLDPGEQLVVRIDVRFSCFAFPVTGNLRAALVDAVFDADNDGVLPPDPDDEAIPAELPAVPMVELGELPPPPVGGIAERVFDSGDASAHSADSSGSSAPPYAAIVGGVAAAVVAVTAGGWYARRRWLR